MARVAARLCLLFTPSLCRRSPWDTLAQAIDGGVDLVQWRPKGPRDDRRDGERCLALCAACSVPMIVNDDVALAVAIGAAGAHVGQDDMPAPEARARLGPDRILGVSTHDLDQVAAAEAATADYVGFGPCYATATKGYAIGVGPAAAGAAARQARVPVFAIGGIDPARARDLVVAGCTRIAISAAILGAEDPARAARALRAALT